MMTTSGKDSTLNSLQFEKDSLSVSRDGSTVIDHANKRSLCP